MQAHIAHCVSCLGLIQLTQLSESSRADAQIKLLSMKASFVKRLACMPVKGAALFQHTPGWQSQKGKSGHWFRGYLHGAWPLARNGRITIAIPLPTEEERGQGKCRKIGRERAP